MALTFTQNSDGTIAVSFTASAVNWKQSGSVLVPDNAGMHAGGDGSVAAGNLPSLSMDNNAAPYLGSIGLHIFYGTDPSQVIEDYFVTIALTSTNSGGTVTAVGHPGGTITYNIPADAVLDSRAVNGIYAQGFVAVAWGPLETTGSPVTVTGWTEIQQAIGANVLTTQALPPSAPTSLAGTINSDGSVTLSWGQSSMGTAALAGYNVKWGTTTGGPYSTGSLFFPISASAPSSSPNFQAVIPASNFAMDGKTRYFIVDAYDDGSTTQSAFSAGTGIVYFPTPPAVFPSSPPTGTPPPIIQPPIIQPIKHHYTA